MAKVSRYLPLRSRANTVWSAGIEDDDADHSAADTGEAAGVPDFDAGGRVRRRRCVCIDHPGQLKAAEYTWIRSAVVHEEWCIAKVTGPMIWRR